MRKSLYSFCGKRKEIITHVRKILITGGAGYIGGTMSRLLLGRGHQVTVYDNLCHSRRSNVAEGATFIEGEVADRALLERVLEEGQFDGVLHFAALIEAGESMHEPERYFRNNSIATLTLLEAMVARGPKRLVFSSTAAVYGDVTVMPIAEDAALRPTNPYGESKLMVEQMLSWFNKIHGLQYASLRYFNVAGAMEGYGEAHEPESHLIPLVLDVALGKLARIKVFGRDYPTRDRTCVRDYIHVQDLAAAHLLALDALQSRDRLIYNIGNGKGFTVMEVIESARRVTGHPIPVEFCARREGDPAELVASSALIRKELGWNPSFPGLDEIVASAWEWHKKLNGR
jgi:UDP-glucose 4-epimerase